MGNSYRPIDPHLRRWMMFVDGENFTLRAQELARAKSIPLQEGTYYCPDVFVWLPDVRPTTEITNMADSPLKLQPNAIRSYFYTSVIGDAERVASVRRALWELGFNPEVFKKTKGQEKAKGVDIALSKDFLSHAFHDNYDVAALVAGDGDYVPLVAEVKRLGKVVYVLFFSGSGLNPELQLASDRFFEMAPFFSDQWKRYVERLKAAAPKTTS